MNKSGRNKRLFFDLNHPADFHLYKNVFDKLKHEGYTLRIMARDKDCLQDLLKYHKITYTSWGKGRHTLVGKYIYAIYVLLLLLIQLIRFRPGLTVSLASPYLILSSRLLGIPSLGFLDTDISPRLYPIHKRIDYLITPVSFGTRFHKHHFRLPIFKELAYLHPKYFPQDKLGDSLFFRLTRTDSIHHTFESRLEFSQIIGIINSYSENYRCILSTEITSPPELSEDIQMADSMNIHNDLLQCRVFWGNSATMAAEAAVLGIPAIFIGSEVFSYIKELEAYGLLFHYHPKDIEASIIKLDKLLLEAKSGDKFIRARKEMLKEKIDVTSFMIWMIEHMPESVRILEQDPDYHLRFKF